MEQTSSLFPNSLFPPLLQTLLLLLLLRLRRYAPPPRPGPRPRPPVEDIRLWKICGPPSPSLFTSWAGSKDFTVFAFPCFGGKKELQRLALAYIPNRPTGRYIYVYLYIYIIGISEFKVSTLLIVLVIVLLPLYDFYSLNLCWVFLFAQFHVFNFFAST